MMGFRFRGWEFRPRLWTSIATLAMIAATVSLGNWQTRRAEDKLELQRRLDERSRGVVLSLPSSPIEAASFEHYRVQARGRFVAAHTLLLDNRVMRGAVGYHVLTPFKIEGGDMHVIVNRGWIAAAPRREDLPRVRSPAGEVALQGVATVPPRYRYELGKDTEAGPLVQHLVLERIEKRTGLRLQPIVLLQTSETDDGLVRAWQRPDSGADTHRAYALQWYGLAVLVAVFYVAYNLRRVQT